MQYQMVVLMQYQVRCNIKWLCQCNIKWLFSYLPSGKTGGRRSVSATQRTRFRDSMCSCDCLGKLFDPALWKIRSCYSCVAAVAPFVAQRTTARSGIGNEGCRASV